MLSILLSTKPLAVPPFLEQIFFIMLPINRIILKRVISFHHLVLILLVMLSIDPIKLKRVIRAHLNFL